MLALAAPEEHSPSMVAEYPSLQMQKLLVQEAFDTQVSDAVQGPAALFLHPPIKNSNPSQPDS